MAVRSTFKSDYEGSGPAHIHRTPRGENMYKGKSEELERRSGVNPRPNIDPSSPKMWAA